MTVSRPGSGTATWERADGRRGLSVARWEQQGDGWRYDGSELVSDDPPYAAAFTVLTGPDWSARDVDVSAFAAAGARRTHLVAHEGHWIVDGVARPDLDGCVDVDIAATPLTNTFPLRRLTAAGRGGPSTSPVAWVDVPSLDVSRVEQTYERLDDRDGLACWRYSDPTYGAFELTVDADGLVVDYAGLARRIVG